MTVTEAAAEPLIRIGEVARGAGVSVRAVRYYEQQGLLTAERSPSGQRLYPRGTVDRVRFFQQMYAAGLSSRNIAELLPCIESGHTPTPTSGPCCTPSASASRPRSTTCRLRCGASTR